MTLQRLVEAQRQSVSPDRFFTRASSDCAALAGAESDLLVLQETARLIAETCRQDILSLLQRGGKVRCMCALDSPEVARMMALRNENLDEQYMLDRMRDGLRMLGVVAAEAKHFGRNLEVRFLPYPPDITAIFKDADHSTLGKRMGLVRLQGFQVTYSHKLDFATDGTQSPHVFEFYKSQLEAMWRSSTKFVLLTGAPGIGKSTLLARVVEALRQFPSLRVDGFLTREMRDSRGQRAGFTTARIGGTDKELAT